MLEIKKICVGSKEYDSVKDTQFFGNSDISEAIENICAGNGVQLYAAEKEDGICAFAVADSATRDVISILFLSVAREQRGAGTATALLDYIIEDTKPKALVAEVLEDSAGFFEKYGFYLNDHGEKYPGKRAYYATYRVTK